MVDGLVNDVIGSHQNVRSLSQDLAKSAAPAHQERESSSKDEIDVTLLFTSLITLSITVM